MKIIVLAGDPDKLLYDTTVSHYFPECNCKHPKQHVIYTETFILKANKKLQNVVTNSEHIINRLRIAHKEGEIKLRIHWYPFEDKPMQIIRVDTKGELSSYPTGLLDEWSNQLIKLL